MSKFKFRDGETSDSCRFLMSLIKECLSTLKKGQFRNTCSSSSRSPEGQNLHIFSTCSSFSQALVRILKLKLPHLSFESAVLWDLVLIQSSISTYPWAHLYLFRNLREDIVSRSWEIFWKNSFSISTKGKMCCLRLS